MAGNKQILYDVAAAQEGFFTAKQAVACGFISTNHPYHVKNGTWEKHPLYRGIYKIAQFPEATMGDYWAVALYFSQSADEFSFSAIFSRETALAIRNIGDFLPRQIYMNRIPGMKIQKGIPTGIILSNDPISPTDYDTTFGFPVMRALSAILVALNSNEVDLSLLRTAYFDAKSKLLIAPNEVTAFMNDPSQFLGRGVRNINAHHTIKQWEVQQ